MSIQNEQQKCEIPHEAHTIITGRHKKDERNTDEIKACPKCSTPLRIQITRSGISDITNLEAYRFDMRPATEEEIKIMGVVQ